MNPEDVTPPDAPLSFWVNQIVFVDGGQVSLVPGQLVIIIGANNAGKSTLLSELDDGLTRADVSGRVVRSVEVGFTGSNKDLEAWISPRRVKRKGYREDEEVLVGPGGEIRFASFEENWRTRPLGPALVGQLRSKINHEARLIATGAADAIDPLLDVPEHPIHQLLIAPQLVDRISLLTARAFGLRMVPDRGGGLKVPLYSIPANEPAPCENEVSPEYLQWLRAHTLLSN